MPKSHVFAMRLSQEEEWLLSYLPEEFPGQLFTERLRTFLVDHASAALAVKVDIPTAGKRIIHVKGLKRGETPVPLPWTRRRS